LIINEDNSLNCNNNEALNTLNSHFGHLDDSDSDIDDINKNDHNNRNDHKNKVSEGQNDMNGNLNLSYNEKLAIMKKNLRNVNDNVINDKKNGKA